MNKWLLSLLGAVVTVGGFFALNSYIYNEKQAVAVADYKDAEYTIDGQRVTLGDGTRYFGNEVVTDLNADGREDIAFLITHDAGGSGTFYYVVAALNTERGYVGSAGLLLGDRIAPQTTEVSQNPNHKGVIVVNYADRAPGEPMTARPSIGKSIWLKLDAEAMQFGEVAQDFEGEADPSRMTLDMKTWVWVSALYNDGKKVEPKQAGKFTLTFLDDTRFSASTDCNSMSGSYTADTYSITFSQIAMTKMYCEGSQESDFATLLQDSAGYLFTSRGELIFDLKFDSGTVTFR